jgi:hypothetical protein
MLPHRLVPILAVARCLSGIVLAFFIDLIGTRIGGQAGLVGYLCFAGFQVAAFGLGLSAWKEPLGKIAVITAAVLLLGSMLLLA